MKVEKGKRRKSDQVEKSDIIEVKAKSVGKGDFLIEANKGSRYRC